MALRRAQQKLIAGIAVLTLAAGGAYYRYGYPFNQTPSAPVVPGNNDFEHPAAYPASTANLTLQQRELFSDPMNGIGLRYNVNNYPGLSLDLNMYPVGALSWVNNPNLLDDEADVILADMDYLIQHGRWQQRLETLREPVVLQEQPALRLHFKLQTGTTAIYKIIFLLVQEDKYVKFSMESADLSPNALQQAQGLVEHLLPQVHAPPESDYARKIRDEHQAKMKQKVQELLRQRQEG